MAIKVSDREKYYQPIGARLDPPADVYEIKKKLQNKSAVTLTWKKQIFFTNHFPKCKHKYAHTLNWRNYLKLVGFQKATTSTATIRHSNKKCNSSFIICSWFMRKRSFLFCKPSLKFLNSVVNLGQVNFQYLETISQMTKNSSKQNSKNFGSQAPHSE